MTPEEYNKWAATEIMGWSLRGGENGYYYIPGNDKGGTIVLWVDNWNPWNNIGQALDCLEEFNPANFEVKRTSEVYKVTINLYTGEWFKMLSQAIIQAIHEAMEGE